MQTSTPSQTAFLAAAARAAHRIVDGAPRILDDHLAAALLGDRADELIPYHRQHGDHPILAGARAQAVVRSAYAERAFVEFVHRGPSQYLLLGAGLDSSPYRLDLAGTPVFELDHPATSAAKQSALAAAGIPTAGATFVPGDLPRIDLDGARPTFVSWLGVVMYLSAAEVARTLRDLAALLSPGSEVVFDHVLPPSLRDAAGTLYAEQVSAVAADGGEPWGSTFTPEEVADLLTGTGWTVLAQPDTRAAVPPGAWHRTDALRPLGLSALTHARLGPST
ncbi:class I SAM-dependent methyltransferase [Asanoa siamensis]|uniref:S-adenosyl-L-methionine-dependent methyltransferase n=1 Tax=Asanoa siamensis TaxID=926357 RepID=A0ABQ4CM02_9ACTN|nr:SAM-dependent methyltransferase [Asanoa siamensis]GIF72008.1 S-adenosyl-L-methionine-dependent methyltransferase [Asanoa siamensis]